MKIFGIEIKKANTESSVPLSELKSDIPFSGSAIYGQSFPIINKVYDGEKTTGELGVVNRNIPHYLKLRLRGVDAFVKTDTIKMLTSRRTQWVIGSGLKLECEPNKTVLTANNITLSEDFKLQVEELWKVYTNSKYVDYEKERNLQQIASDIYADKFKGGDMLVICRIENHGPVVQVVSGEFVESPPTGAEILKQKGENNNIQHGIELSPRGNHVAYYVKKQKGLGFDYDRIPAFGDKSKRRLAWMVYAQKLTSDQKRGVPEFSQVIEKVNKLDRYSDAALGKAEQAANLVYAIEHKEFSTGENPLSDLMKKKIVGNDAPSVTAIDPQKLGDGLANRITQTTSNQTYNLPPGASLKDFKTDIETSYSDFKGSNFDDIAAAVDTPPEVARQQYNSNYSASRAAINAWGYIVEVDRNDFSEQFYKPIYALWLEFMVLTNKVKADGLVKAILSDDFMIVQSYLQCRFVGRNMPHIDPLKEVKAVELMLQLELISREQATEILNVGDFHENIEELQAENEKFNLKKEDNNGNNNQINVN